MAIKARVDRRGLHPEDPVAAMTIDDAEELARELERNAANLLRSARKLRVSVRNQRLRRAELEAMRRAEWLAAEQLARAAGAN